MSIDPLTDEELRDIIISELNKTQEGNSMYLSKWVKEALFAVLFFILAVILLMALQQANDYKKDAEAFVIYEDTAVEFMTADGNTWIVDVDSTEEIKTGDKYVLTFENVGDDNNIYNDKVIRSSQGAIFKLNFINAYLPDFIKSLKDYSVYGTNVVNGISLENVKKSQKMAIVLGNEGNGISKEVFDVIEKNIYIPMDDTESLNVSVAAGIIMYNLK